MSLLDPFIRAMTWIQGTGASDAVLHIHGGMIVLLLARLLTGRSLGSPVPLLCVVAAGLLKEWLDYTRYGHVKPDSLSDLVNTVFWPSVLFLGVRLRKPPRSTHRDR